MIDHKNELQRLQARFSAWNASERPSVEHMPRWEQDLKDLLSEVARFCQSTTGLTEELRPQLKEFLGRIDRTHRAAATFPLPPDTHAVLDPSQGVRAGELADYLRRHSVDATIQTLYTQVHAGYTFFPFFSSVYQTIKSGIRVGGGVRAYHPATEFHSRRRR